MLEVAGLAKSFPSQRGRAPVRALRGIDFAVSPGEIYGLLGPNGAGKTTALRLIAGLLRPSGGEARFEGRPVSQASERMRRMTGVVCESGGVYDRLTGDEYLRFFAGMFGMERSRARSRIDELIDRLDLGGCRHRRLGTFSKGMKQKIHLARALLHDPRLLLLDEPTSGLDPAMTEALWEVLDEFGRGRPVAVVLCTHNLDEAERLCDRVAIIVSGAIVKEGRPDRLKSEAHGGGTRAVKAVLARDSDAVAAAVRTIEGVISVEALDGGTLHIVTARRSEDVNPPIARTIVEKGGELVSLHTEETSLREVYLAAIKGGQP